MFHCFHSHKTSFYFKQSIGTVQVLSIQNMFISLKLLFYFLIFQWKLVSAEFLQLNETSSDTLRVLALDSKPFIHYAENQRIYKGIEYDLVKVLAEKLNLKLSIDPKNPKNHSSFDVVIGGLSNAFGGDLLGYSDLKFSSPYFQDNFIWCVKDSGSYPIQLFYYFLLASPECWIIIIFGFGYGSGFILYMFIQYDTNYKYRNFRDWHYTTWLISLPVTISMGPRFKPIYGPLRIFYGFMLISGMLISTFVLTYTIRTLGSPYRNYQIKTQEEIVLKKYRLFGSRECLEVIKFDSKVCKLL